MKATVIYFLILCIPIALLGQTAVDGKELTATKEQINILTALAKEWSTNNIDSSLQYAQQAVELAYEVDDKKSLQLNLLIIGNGFAQLKEYQRAKEVFDKAEDIDAEDHELKIQLANERGILYRELMERDTALAYHLKAKELASGAYMNDAMLSNVCKHNVTRFPYELSRIAQDIAGGIMVTMPSEADYKSEEVGEIVDRFLRGRADIPTEDRMRILRLIENMTLGRNAVGYLTESMHGAGSPQAQRIQILRGMNVEEKKQFARDLAGIKS